MAWTATTKKEKDAITTLQEQARRVQGDQSKNVAVPDTTTKPIMRPQINFEEYLTPYDQQRQKMYEESQNVTPRNELRRERLREMQGELDAIRDVSRDLVQKQRQINQNNVGRVGAMSRGLGASARFALQNRAEGAGQSEISQIGNQTRAQIASVESRAAELANNEALLEKQAKAAGSEAYSQYLLSKQERDTERANAVVENLLTTDTTPEDLTDEEVASIAKAANVSPEEVRLQYQSGYTQRQEQKQAEEEAKTQALRDTKIALMTEAADSGADTGTLDRIMAATDDVTAASIASAFIGKQRATEIAAELQSEYALAAQRNRSNQPKSSSSEEGSEYHMAEQYAATFEGTDEQLKSELLRDSDLSVSEINAIIAARHTAGSEGITRSDLASFYGLEDSDERSSILGFEYGSTGGQQLDSLMSQVELYRSAGYTDKEIMEILTE